jgi:hypothetical protein
MWMRTFGSMLRSRVGVWIISAEVLILAAVMVAFWWTWQDESANLVALIWTYVQALPLALVSVYALPALLFVAGAMGREMLRALLQRMRGQRVDPALASGRRAKP